MAQRCGLAGFQWISCDDYQQSVISFRRIDDKGKEVIVVCNFCPVERTGYKIGVPKAGAYVPVLSSDDAKYGGAGTALGPCQGQEKEMHGLKYSVELTLPAMSTVFYERRSTPRDAKDEDGGKGRPRLPKKTAAKARHPRPQGRPGPRQEEAGPQAEAELQDAGYQSPRRPQAPR